MEVIFTRNPLEREGGSFRKGQVVDLDGPSLKRWLRRGAVEPYTEPPTKQADSAAAPRPEPTPEPTPEPDPPPKPKRRRTTKPKPKPKPKSTEG